MTTRLALVVTLISLIVVPPAAAQSESKITGVVRDATALVIAGATLTATNRTTRETRTATTGVDGTYAIAVPLGSWFVTAAFPGFRTSTQTVDVTPGEPKTADFTLETMLSEEITVTATKREQTLLDVPFSVAAVPEETLRKRGVADIEDVAANVAGFTVQNLGPGQSQVAMRGVSAGQIVRDQPGVKEQVGVYLDESVISLSLFTPDLDLFDTNRVEVLRGPQGTLFGSGSLSGTVRYITNQPELGVTQGVRRARHRPASTAGVRRATSSSGSTCRSANKAAAARGVVLRPHRRLHRRRAAEPVASRRTSTTATGPACAASVRITPNDNLTITPRIVYQRVQTDGWNRDRHLQHPRQSLHDHAAGGDARRARAVHAARGAVHRRFRARRPQHRLRASAHGLLTSITSYTYRDILVVRDATALTASITGGSIGLPANVYTLNAPLNDATTAKAWTQELRFSGGLRPFPWVAGGFYSHRDRDYGQNLLGDRLRGPVSGIPTQGLRAPKDALFFSDLALQPRISSPSSAKATLSVTDRVQTSPAACATTTSAKTSEQVFDGIFANDNTGTSLVSQPGSTERQRRRAALHRQLQAVGPRRPERAGLAGLPARRHQRPAQRPALHAAGPRHVRRTRHLEGRDGLELRGRARSRGC